MIDAEDEDKTVSVMLDGEESFLSFVDGISRQVNFTFSSQQHNSMGKQGKWTGSHGIELATMRHKKRHNKHDIMILPQKLVGI